MKRNRKIIYYAVMLFGLGTAALMIDWANLWKIELSLDKTVLVIFLAALVHFLKFFRLYLIFLEEDITILNTLKTYIKTTFVSIAFPYKIGELFKMYNYGYEIKSFPRGVIAVLIEKFYDALILCVILIPSNFFFGGAELSTITYLLGLFLAVVAIIYSMFEATYAYLNKNLIVRGSNKEKNIYALRLLERIHDVFLSAKKMISGRQMALIILSIGAWVFEVLILFILGNGVGVKVGLIDVARYISDGFFGVSNVLYQGYINLCTIILFLGIIIVYIVKFLKIGKSKNGKEKR